MLPHCFGYALFLPVQNIRAESLFERFIGPRVGLRSRIVLRGITVGCKFTRRLHEYLSGYLICRPTGGLQLGCVQD